MRRLSRILSLLALLCVATAIPHDAAPNEFLAWVDVRSDWTPTTTGADTLTVGEGSVTDDVFALGRALEIQRVGESAYTTGYTVTGYASGGASHRATVTVDGPDLGSNGTIRIRWLSDDVLPVVRVGAGAPNLDPEDYSPGWWMWDGDSPTELRICQGALGARSWDAIAAAPSGAAGGGLGGTYPDPILSTTNTIYVDPTAGKADYQTITAALAAAASGDVVKVAPGTYTENISVPEGVRVLGEWSNLTGAITLEGDDAFVSLYAQTVATGTTGLTLDGVNKTGIANIRYQLNAGTADGISVTDAASALFYTGTLQTVENGEGLSSGSAGSVYYDLPLIDVSGTGTGIYASPTADASGYVGQIDDDGAGVGLYVEALGAMNLDMVRLDANTAYQVEATGELELTVNEIVGAEINAGTATVVVADDIARWVDQDVTSGASPNFDGNNFTGIAADDVDLVTVPSGNCTGDTTVDGCLATLDAASLGGLSPRWDADFSTAHDFTASATLGNWTAAGDLADFATFEFTGGVLSFSCVTPGADKTVTLTYDLDADGYESMRSQGGFKLISVWSLTTFSDTNGNYLNLTLENDDSNEVVFHSWLNDGGNKLVYHDVRVNGAWAGGASGNDNANWDTANNAIVSTRSASQWRTDKISTGHTVVTPATRNGTPHLRDGTIRLILSVTCKSGATVTGTLNAIEIDGLY